MSIEQRVSERPQSGSLAGMVKEQQGSWGGGSGVDREEESEMRFEGCRRFCSYRAFGATARP